MVVLLFAGALLGDEGNDGAGIVEEKITPIEKGDPFPKEETMAPSSSTQEAHKVIRVVDGDTLIVDIAGDAVRVRIIGINTPESVHPERPVECFGEEASARLTELLEGGSVVIEYDPSQGIYDKYGRTLGYLFLPDGTDVGGRMIAEGYAYEYTYDLPYRYQGVYEAAEVSARERGLGLWSPDACNR